MSSRVNFSKNVIVSLAISFGQMAYLTPLAVMAADGAVRISGQTIFENKVASGGMSVGQRAETIQKNLDNALVAAKDRSPSAVSIVYVKGIPVITLGGYQVCTVDADNAKAVGLTPAVLAQRWTDSLRKALADKNSIDSYVAQLTGTYQANAPAQIDNSISTAPAPTTNVSYQNQPPQQGFGGPGYQQGMGAGYPQAYPGGPGVGPGQYTGQVQYSSQNPYAGSAQNFGAPGYGAGVPQYGGGVDQFGRSTGIYGGGPMQGMQRGRVAYAPAGLVMSATLNTSIATQAAQSGDLIQATISQPIMLGDSQIPPGSVLVGTVTEAKHGGFLGIAGTLGVKFNRLRTPDGIETPISAHIEGGVGKYQDKNGNDVFRGETWKTKAGQAAIRGGIGAGAGAALGTAVGAIAGGGRGVGRGAWSGTAIGAGVGVLDSLVLRKGKDVVIQSGQQVQVQLDAPVSISVGGPSPYTGAF